MTISPRFRENGIVYPEVKSLSLAMPKLKNIVEKYHLLSQKFKNLQWSIKSILGGFIAAPSGTFVSYQTPKG
jgi:hypothetical protein